MPSHGAKLYRLGDNQPIVGVSTPTPPADASPAAASTTTYDLQGRAVANPSAGIYITQGRKVHIK